MEAEERPAKLRKLEHAVLSEDSATVEHEVSAELRHQRVNAEEAGHWQSSGADLIETNEPDGNDSESSTSGDPAGLQPPGQQFISGLPLSKNALKKIRNQERWEAGRDARKLKRKQKIADKRIRKRAAKEEARAAAEANHRGKKTTIPQGARLVRENLLPS
jgi:tRNA (guanine9-N1)-methyltransferase